MRRRIEAGAWVARSSMELQLVLMMVAGAGALLLFLVRLAAAG